jgi:hypothetical protein
MSGEIPNPTPESEVILEPGVNVLILPDFRLPSKNHPMIRGGDKSPTIPMTADAIRSSLENFFKDIEQQGGQIVGLVKLPVTENMEEVRYAGDAKVGEQTFVVVNK